MVESLLAEKETGGRNRRPRLGFTDGRLIYGTGLAIYRTCLTIQARLKDLVLVLGCTILH